MQKSVEQKGSIVKGVGQNKFTKVELKRVYRLALLGMTNQEIAEHIGVDQSQFAAWMRVDSANAAYRPELKETLLLAREDANAIVAQRLYERAKGFKHKETKFFVIDGEIVERETTKRYAPDTQAAMYILNNRRPDQWKNRNTVESNQPAVQMSAPNIQIVTDQETIDKLMKDKQAREDGKAKGD